MQLNFLCIFIIESRTTIFCKKNIFLQLCVCNRFASDIWKKAFFLTRLGYVTFLLILTLIYALLININSLNSMGGILDSQIAIRLPSYIL